MNQNSLHAAIGANTPSISADNPIESQLTRLLAKVPPIIRLPKPGARCPYTQLSRSGLVELVAPTPRNGNKPPVQAVYHRAHRHAQRGVWLIPAENLFRFLLSQQEGAVAEYMQTAENAKA